MIEFKDRLKELMIKKGNLSPEKLSKTLEEIDSSKTISTSTLRNYIKGKTTPRDIEQIKILANFFNVSLDYILGLTDEPSTNINIKAIYKEYGLTEKSLLKLKKLNSIKVYNSLTENNESSEIDTINLLLEGDINEGNSITFLIHQYLTTILPEDYYFNINTINNKFVLSNSRYGNIHINSGLILKGILVEIEHKLIEMKEGEKNECKRNRKK